MGWASSDADRDLTVNLDQKIVEVAGSCVHLTSKEHQMQFANASSGKNYIETVWGRDYVLREPTEAEARMTA